MKPGIRSRAYYELRLADFLSISLTKIHYVAEFFFVFCRRRMRRTTRCIGTDDKTLNLQPWFLQYMQRQAQQQVLLQSEES